MVCGGVSVDMVREVHPVPPPVMGESTGRRSQVVIFAITVLSCATIELGSGGKPRSGPKLCPLVMAYVKNFFSAAALGELCGTIA